MTYEMIVGVGALRRRQVRQMCLLLDLEYREERGFLNSLFVIEGSKESLEHLQEAMEGTVSA